MSLQETATTKESLKRCENMLLCGTTSIKVLIDKGRRLEDEVRVQISSNREMDAQLRKYSALEGWSRDTMPDIRKYLGLVRYHYNNIDVVDLDVSNKKTVNDMMNALNGANTEM